MWQEIIIGILLAASLYYIGRRIFKAAVKGEHEGCADCPPAEVRKQSQN